MENRSIDKEIIMNYTPRVMDLLFRDIPHVPAIIGDSEFIRGDISQILSIPFTYDLDLLRSNHVLKNLGLYKYMLNNNKHYTAMRNKYHSKTGLFQLSGLMTDRFMDIYNADNENRLKGQIAIICSDFLEDKLRTESDAIVYGVCGFSEHSGVTRPMLNYDTRAMNMLFNKTQIVPAHITRKPVLDRSSGHSDYAVYFTFSDNKDMRITDKDGYGRMNPLALTKFMHQMDAVKHEDLISKNISVYVLFMPKIKEKVLIQEMIICGIGSNIE